LSPCPGNPVKGKTARQLPYRWIPERGSGSHGTLCVGRRFTVVKDLNNELGPGLLSDMYKQDLPEALTGGDDLEDTLVEAADCLAEAIAGRIVRGDAIPAPSKLKHGQYPISVPLYLAPKIALYLAMREGGIRNTELAKRLGVSETVVRRMLDPKHATKPERIQAALAALGRRIVVRFETAA
jgi:antitoxin HicB